MVSPSDIYGGNSPEESARIFLKILNGKGSWAQNAVVLANAAMALYCTGIYANYDHAFAAAVESLESRKGVDGFKHTYITAIKSLDLKHALCMNKHT